MLLGRSWGELGAFGVGLGASWFDLVGSWAALRTILDALGPLLEPLGVVWGRGWELKSRSWDALGASECVEEAILCEKTGCSAKCVFLEREGYF